MASGRTTSSGRRVNSTNRFLFAAAQDDQFDGLTGQGLGQQTFQTEGAADFLTAEGDDAVARLDARFEGRRARADDLHRAAGAHQIVVHDQVAQVAGAVLQVEVPKAVEFDAGQGCALLAEGDQHAVAIGRIGGHRGATQRRASVSAVWGFARTSATGGGLAADLSAGLSAGLAASAAGLGAGFAASAGGCGLATGWPFSCFSGAAAVLLAAWGTAAPSGAGTRTGSPRKRR